MANFRGIKERVFGVRDIIIGFLGFLGAMVLAFLVGVRIGMDMAKHSIEAEIEKSAELLLKTEGRETELREEKVSKSKEKEREKEREKEGKEKRKEERREERAKKIKAEGWSVQVAAFKELGKAREMLRKLERKGYPVYITKYEKSGKIWFRVRVGPYSSKNEAEVVVKGLEKIKMKGFLVKEG